MWGIWGFVQQEKADTIFSIAWHPLDFSALIDPLGIRGKAFVESSGKGNRGRANLKVDADLIVLVGVVFCWMFKELILEVQKFAFSMEAWGCRRDVCDQ